MGGLSHYQAFGFASNKLVRRFYAQCGANRKVKPDYLIRLDAIWYRLDTNWAHSMRFDRRARSLALGKAAFEREKRRHALARAHFDRLAAIDENFRGPRA